MAKKYGWRDLLNAEEKGLAKPSKNSSWRELLEYEQGSGLSADYYNETVKQGTDTYNRVAKQAGNLAQRYSNKGYIDPKQYDAHRGATDKWLKQWQNTFDNLQSLGYDVSSLSGISEGYQQVGSAMDKMDMSRYAGAKDERDYYNKRLQDDIDRGEVNPANISTIGPRVAGKAQREKAADTYKGKPGSIFSQTLHEANLRNQAENEAEKRRREEQLKKLQPYLPEYPNRPAGQPMAEPLQADPYEYIKRYERQESPQVELKKDYATPQSLDPSRRIASAGSTDFSFDRPQNWSAWMEQVQQAATPAPPKTDSLGRKVEDISITGGIIRGNTIHNLPAEAQEYYETTTSEGAKAKAGRLQAQHDELMAERNRVFQDISDMDRALGHAPSPQDVEAYRNFVNTQVMRPKAAETLEGLDKQLSDLNEQITNTNNQATILALKENYKGFEDDPIATQKFNADMYKAKFGAEWDKMPQLEKVGIIAGDAAKMGMYTAAGGWYALSDIMGDVLGMPKNEWSQLNKELRDNLQSEMTLQAQKMGPATEAVQALISATVDTVPATVMAVLSGGTTVAATAKQTLTTAGQGLWAGVRQSALEMFKSPNFIFNLLSEGGRGYEEERAKGYSPTEAAVNASLKAFPNAMIEQGGIQSAMQRPNVIKELVRTGLEEGGEEITQGTVGNAYDFIRSGKIMQPELDDIISWDNPEAVIAGKKMLEEGAMGAAVGGILGGTQAGVRKIGDAVMGGAEPGEVDWEQYWKKIDAEQDAQIAAKQQQEAAAPVVKSFATTVNEVAERLSLDTAAADKLNADLAASKLDEATFSDAYTRAYQAGLEGIDPAYLTSSTAVAKLSPDLAKIAYDLGTKNFASEMRGQKMEAAAAAKLTKLKPGEGGVTYHASVDKAKLRPYQQNQINIWDTVAKVLGLNAVMFQSATDAEGNIIAGAEFGMENGKYEYSTGRIWIDVNAQKKNVKDSVQAIILKTAGHEVTHFIKHLSPVLYREYSRAVTQALANAGQDLDTLIDEQIARSAKGSAGEIDFGIALEEVIANQSDLMLRDSQVIAGIRESNPTLFNTIKDWITDFSKRVQDAFDRFRGTVSATQKAIMKDVEGVLRYPDELRAAWDAALGDAAGIAPVAPSGGEVSAPATVTMTMPSMQETAKAAAQSEIVPADAKAKEDAGVRFQERDNSGVLITDKYSSLNPNQDISKLDGVPAVRLIDGSVIPATGAPTHVSFIKNNKIDAADIDSGGWITKGLYEPSFRSETSPYIQRELAKRRLTRYQERDPVPPMYSKMEQEIAAYKGNKVDAGSFVKYLTGRGVKADEIRWSGVQTFLQGKKSVTKAELLEFARGNALNIKDVGNERISSLTISDDAYRITLDGEDGRLMLIEPQDDGTWYDRIGMASYDTRDDAYWAARDVADNSAEEIGTKFEKYALPGGTNYREVLFTVPDLDGSFQSAHWDEENVLAHTRLQDFQTPDGKPVLFIEEVQSDWHEKGREEGYAKPVNVIIGEYKSQGEEGYPDIAQVHDDNENLIGYIMPMHGKYVADAGNGRRIGAYETEKQALDALAENEKYRFSEVPEAPFAATWHEYVLKRALRMAAEGDYDYMAWTTGAMQADRYGLEKTLSRVVSYKLDNSTVRIGAFGRDGGQVSLGTTSFDLASAQAMFGKELGTTLYNGGMNATGDDTYELKGTELRIGGGGMKNFYDIGGKSSQNIPRFLNKYGAQWGAGISTIEIQGDKTYSVPAIEINERMKESVLYEGQVLYQERDSDGAQLTAEQAEFFRDSKVRDAQGRLLKVYHGSPNKFTTFSREYIGANTGRIDNGAGFYFSSEKMGMLDSGASWYGDNITEAYLDIKNPLLLTDASSIDLLKTAAQLRPDKKLDGYTLTEILDVYSDVLNREFDASDGARDNSKDIQVEYDGRTYTLRNYTGNIENNREDVARYFVSSILDVSIPVRLGEYRINNEIIKNYDGVINGNEYVVFSPEQIKSTANLTPTSDPDIRFQERTDDPSSAREILSTGFEAIAANDAERSLLKTYQGRVKELNAMEQAVTDYRTQIQAIESSIGFDPKAPNDRLIRLKNNVKTLTDKINRADKKLLTFEKAAPLKNVLDREVKKVQEKQAQIRRVQLEQYRDNRATTDSKRKLRDQIIRKVKKVNDLLVNESDKRHIPERLKAVAIEFMQPFLQDTSVFYRDQLNRFRDVYDAIGRGEHEGESYLQSSYLEELSGDLRDIALTLDGRRLSQLTEAELETVLNVVGNLEHMIQYENAVDIAGKREEVSSLSGAVADEHRDKAKDKRVALLTGNNPVAMVVKMLSSQNIKPIYFFKSLGGTMKRLFDDIRMGQRNYGLTLKTSRDYFIEIATRRHYWDWTAKKGDIFKFKTAIGDDIELTREQALSLYAISKREKTNIQQKASHLAEGGFVFTDAVQVTEYHKGIPVKYTVNTAETHPLNETDVEQVNAWLTDEQRGFADDMVRYLSNEMADLGNEASMKLYGIRKYLEKYYFPYKSSSNFLYRQQGQGAIEGMQNTLKHRSFTKRTVQFANNPIVLDDFTKVWGGHVETMVMYNSMVIPLENFNRVYNYKTRSDIAQGIKPESVKSVLEAAYGRKAKEYIEQLIDDLNGGVRPPKAEALTDKMIGLFKKGAVFANLSVVVQQPSAIMRAMALIDPKHFLSAFYTKADNAEMLKYSGVAVLKEMGRFDVGLGMGSAEWLTRQDRKQLNVAQAMADKDVRDDMLAYLPRRADEMTWTSIWRAVKNEVAAEEKLQRGTPEFMAAVTERFEDVIDYTQVYDSVLARSEMMRAKSGMMKSITAFMSEPTTSYNMLYDAFANRKDKGAKDHVAPARAMAAFAASIILNSLLKALVMAMRDDDEDKTYVEKYINSAAEGIIDGMNPVGMVPIFRDILSIVQGYDVNRADMALITDLYRALDKANSDRYTAMDKIEGIAGAVAAFLGVPVKNVWRDGKGIYGLITSKMPISATTGAGVKNALMEALPGYNTSLNAYYRRLYDAINDGDMNKQAELTEILMRKGKEQKTIDAGLRKLAREAALEGAISPSTAMEQLKRFGVDSVNTDVRDLYDANVITQDEAVRLLEQYGAEKMDAPDERYKIITKWNHERTVPEGEDSDYKVMDNFLEAVKTGKNLRNVVADYMDPKKYGYSKSYLAGQITEAYKPKYIALMKTDRKAAASLQGYLLNAYAMLGYDRDDRKKAIDKWLKP